MKILIVEDETSALEHLQVILSEFDNSIETVGCTENITDTVQWLLENPSPDLIIMDIHLSDGPAFEIFDRIKVSSPVIFTSAYDEYALKAFKANAIDYLLKPVKFADMKNAIEKFKDITGQMLLNYIARVSELRPQVKYAERLLVTYRDKLIPVEVSDVSFFYTESGETTVYLSDGNKYVYFKPLESIIQTLNPSQYFRANRQFVLAKSKVKGIAVWPDSRLVITMDVESPEHIFVSKNRASDFRKWIIED